MEKSGGQQGSNNGSKYLKIRPAIAPKPMLNVLKLLFNPTMKKSVNEQLNTSKNWVLPPRPRPGRKPNDEVKKEKKKKEEKEKKVVGVAGTAKVIQDDHTELKMVYLKKLKEQEMIQHYIEIITNQINELSFAKNGIITFDALNFWDLKNNKKSVDLLEANLDNINNINDLNKILNTSLQPPPNLIEENWLNSQINYYLDSRAKLKKKNQKVPSNQNCTTSNSTTIIPELLKPLPRSLDYLEFSDDLIIDSDFDNLIMDSNNNIIDDSVNLIDDESDMLGLVKIYDMKNFDDSQIVESNVKKRSKLNCGFCTNDTPCLCLGADI